MGEIIHGEPSTSVSNVLKSNYTASKFKKRPLIGKDFILDLDNVRNRQVLKKEIEQLGGIIVETFDDERAKPFCIVSDYPHVELLEKPKKILSNIKFLSTLPMMLRSAVQSEVRIRSVSSFQMSLSNLRRKLRTERKVLHAPVKMSQSQIRQLTAPYIKIEHRSGEYAPSFKEFVVPTNFKPIYLGKMTGKSIFHKVTAVMAEKRLREEKGKLNKIPKPLRPRTQLCSGFCDICAQTCENLRLHYASKDHLRRISQPGFYDEVDALCGSFSDDISVPQMPLLRRRERSPSLDDSKSQFWSSSSSLEDDTFKPSLS